MKLKDLSIITSKGSVTLFLIAFGAALTTGSIAMFCTYSTAKVLTLTAIAGILFTMGISKVASILGMKFAISDNPGTLGTIVALLVILMIL